MQPQSDKSMIDRVIERLRGLWRQSSGDRSVSNAESDHGQGDRSDQIGAASDAADSTVADAATPGKEQTAGATGASYDEFASGGYAGEPIGRDTVDAAAERESDNETVSAAVNFDPERGYSPFATDAGSDPPPVDRREDKIDSTGVGLDPERAYSTFATDAGSDPSSVDRANVTAAVDSSGTTVGDLGVDDAGDLDAGELGSLEELDGEKTEFEGDASVSVATELVDDEPNTLSDFGHDASDYSTAAIQDQGMRTVDDDDPGITMGQETETDFGADSPLDYGVDSGTDVESASADSLEEIEDEVTDYSVQGASVAGAERPGDALGDAALSDAEFETPGVPDEFVGDSANLELESAPEIGAAETNEEQGATGDLGASEFGSLNTGEVDGAESGDESDEEYPGPFGGSDIDTTDLSYLDDSDNNRFEFSDVSTNDSATVDATSSSDEVGAGVADDIGASPSGVMDSEGIVESDADGSFLADASGGDSSDFDASATSGGAVDSSRSTDFGASNAPGADQLRTDTSAFAGDNSTDAASPTVAAGTAGVAGSGQSSPGASVQGGSDGRTRSDDSGGCPADYPIKGNASSKIYHLPDILSYQGTKAAWCFATEADAIAAGYRAPAGHRNRAAGGSSAAGGAPAAAASGDASSIGVEPESTTALLAGQHTDDEQWSMVPDDDSEDDFGNGVDDVESLQHQPPDDDVANEYAEASPDGGEQITTEFGVAAAPGYHGDVDTLLTEDDQSSRPEEPGYAGSVKGDSTKECPADYPIKGNTGSMIYHAPGRVSYLATIPDWCFATAEDAENAGFRAPKR